MRKLKRLRIILSVFSVLAVPAAMLLAPQWMPYWLIPGFLAALLLACFCGRWYCAVVCPVGILQEAAGAALRFFTHGRYHYRPVPNRRILRYSVLIAVFTTMLCGIAALIAPLEPYSNFARLFASALRPGVVAACEALGWYGLAARPVTGFMILWALGTGLLVFLLVAWRGRIFCQTLCPLGALLGLAARRARFQLAVNPGKCIRCRKCLSACSSGCIAREDEGVQIDFERCTLCCSCGTVCPTRAIGFRQSPPTVSLSPLPHEERRSFLIAAGATAVGAASAALLLRGERRQRFDAADAAGSLPVMPPGAQSLERFTSRCTACGLCVTACTGKVLRPAGISQYGLAGIGQPYLNFDHAMCEFHCNRCSNVCPTGALHSLTLPHKQLTRIGVAKYLRANCVVYLDPALACGACAEHCPTGALTMEETPDGYRLPFIVEELCIGCGSCYAACPQRPKCPIRIEGVRVQDTATDPKDYVRRRPETAKAAEPESGGWAF